MLTAIRTSAPTAIRTLPVARCPLGSGLRWLRSGGAHCDRELAIEVRRCPLRFGLRRLKPHAIKTLPVEVLLWPGLGLRRLRSDGARYDPSPAIPTAIASWKGGGKGRGRRRRRGRGRGRERGRIGRGEGATSHKI